MNAFLSKISAAQGGILRCIGLRIVQVNLGARCNQGCRHCHLAAGPDRTESMDWRTMELVRRACVQAHPEFVDLTGGAPELNPNFRRFVDELVEDGHVVQSRTNLTVLLEDGMENLPEFLASRRVRLVASLPCYLEENVRRQRGQEVYRKSIEALRRLNDRGYGSDPDLELSLVYNPVGPFLPPSQTELEAQYRAELESRFSVRFTKLLTITNMPLGRFNADLRDADGEEKYLGLLQDSFNPETVSELMCRHQVSIGWDGTLYDCDFNLAMNLPVDDEAPQHVETFDVEVLRNRRIVTRDYCFGCTAGSGSSCGGALA